MPGKDGYFFLSEFSELEHMIKSECTIVLLVSSRPSFNDRKFSSTIDLTSLRILEKPLTVEALRKLKVQLY